MSKSMRHPWMKRYAMSMFTCITVLRRILALDGRVHEQQRGTSVKKALRDEHVHLHYNIFMEYAGIGWAELPAHSPALRNVGRTQA